MEKRKLKSFISTKINFGDYILFQEYNSTKDGYNVSKPILAIYINCFVADQALGFKFLKMIKEDKSEEFEISTFIEWTDHTDILGFWRNKPTFKELLKAYRNCNKNKAANSNQIILE